MRGLHFLSGSCKISIFGSVWSGSSYHQFLMDFIRENQCITGIVGEEGLLRRRHTQPKENCIWNKCMKY